MEEGCKKCEYSDEDEEDKEDVDPRVQGELESLNSASNEINVLETELEQGRTSFRSLLSDSTQNLNLLCKKLGKCIGRARPYYELLKESRRAQAEAQRAAVNFQRANSVYKAAKDTVSLAEGKLVSQTDGTWQFDSAWQEMLNHATMKFMESEKEKAVSEEEHSKKAAEYANIQQKLLYLEKDIPTSISKARPYFEMKEKLEHQLQMERQNVEDLQRALACAKQRYKASLDSLEAISEEVHRKRKLHLDLPPRTPGVGAESVSDQSDLPSINLDNISLSDTASQLSYDEQGLVSEQDISLARNIYRVPSFSDSPRKMAQNEAGNPALNQKMCGGVRGPGNGEAAAGRDTESPLPESNGTVETGSLRKGGIGAYLAQRNGSLSEGGYDSSDSSPHSSPVLGDRTRRRKKKLQSQKAFPILQGLTATNQQMSPRLMRANAAQGRFEAIVIENDGSPKQQRSQRSLSWQQDGEFPWKHNTGSHGSPRMARQILHTARQQLVATEVSAESFNACDSSSSSQINGKLSPKVRTDSTRGKPPEQPSSKSHDKEEIFV